MRHALLAPFTSQIVCASDSTLYCARHLISMTTRKDMIPSRRKLNSNSASFGSRTHKDIRCRTRTQ